MYFKFTEEWRVDYVTSLPLNPNSFIQSQIRTVWKQKIRTPTFELALLSIRTTPINNNLASPELLVNRRLNLPITYHVNKNADYIYSELKLWQDNQKRYFNLNARRTELSVLHPGQQVRIQERSLHWTSETVTNALAEPRSYQLKTMSGRQLRQNRIQIGDAPTDQY